MLYEKNLSEFNRLESQIATIEKALTKLPNGKLTCSQTGKYSKWYQSFGESRIYIPKSDQKFAEQLALKTYLSSLLKEATSEKSAIKFYLNHHKFTKKSEHYLLHPVFRKLLAPYFTPLSEELDAWMHTPYQHNPYHTEYLTHKTASGIYVRSKSEVLIDMVLYTNKIPFRYECALQLGEVTIYPDFTICHPKTGETFFWEHFGRADDSNYSKNIGHKLQLYISNNIIPSINLITTFETKDHPLDPTLLQEIVEKYFL